MYKTRKGGKFPNVRNDKLVASILAINTRFDTPICGDTAMVQLKMYQVGKEISEQQESKPYIMTYGEAVRKLLYLDDKTGNYFAVKMRPINQSKYPDHGIIKSPTKVSKMLNSLEENPVASTIAVWDECLERSIIMRQLDPNFMVSQISQEELEERRMKDIIRTNSTYGAIGRSSKDIIKNLFDFGKAISVLKEILK